MTYNATIIEDSIAKGARLTTFEVTFPRFILAEVNTHRTCSRSSASSRAIPVKKRIETVRANTFVPEAFALNVRGMQAGDLLTVEEQQKAQAIWLSACESACIHAEQMEALGVHKQWANRLLEPFMWQTCVITGTEWENFYNLRAHPDAQPEFAKIARMMKEVMAGASPKALKVGEWHLPYVSQEERLEHDQETLCKVSTARCARVSYLTHDGKRDIQADLHLFSRLQTGGHIAPLEHAAKHASKDVLSAANPSNFRPPWLQYRKTFKGEDVFRL